MKYTNKGFTLVEILAAVTLLGVIASILFGILFTSLRGASRAESQTAISQNGTIALSQISRAIRESGNVTGIACVPDIEDAIATDSMTLTTVQGDDINITCSGMPEGTIASNGASLIDEENVVVTECSFSCTQADGFSRPVVILDFTLNNAGGSNFLEGNAEKSFQTSVSLRNIR